ncbi:MAG: permease [Candidatus Saganbacteria bacterium]|nr:permease [Candidatus Saganbacteria bacterium]
MAQHKGKNKDGNPGGAGEIMQILIVVSIICLILSFLVSRKKTLAGVKRGGIMFLNLLPAVFIVIFLTSVFLYLIPEKAITEYLGVGSGFFGVMGAALVGSISLIPGFVAYPLSGLLISRGVGYTVVAVFITTLMMVGMLTLPIEIKYFGRKAAIMRNALSFIGALVIGLLIGVFIK